MSGLQDFLSAIRTGNIDVAKQIYTNMVPSSPSETMTMRSQTDTLQEDKSPRRWREDAATGARQVGVNRDGSSAISGDNALGIGAVDVNPLTAVPAAMADFQETRERVKQGDAGPFEYGLTAAAIPLAAAPAVGGVAGKALARGGKAIDAATTGASRQMRRLLGQEAPMSVRMPNELNIGQKLDVTNTGNTNLPSTYGIVDRAKYTEEEFPPVMPSYNLADKSIAESEAKELGRLYERTKADIQVEERPAYPKIKEEANPARSRETETYYHGVKPKSKHGKEWSDWNVGPAVDRDSALENRNRIIESGFRKGASAELGDAGTSVSSDPTLSLRNFANNDSSNMLVVQLENAVNTQNTDPYTYLTKQHREGNPEAVRKPNVFKEDETFFRTEGGGQEQLRARLPTRPEINFMERGSNAVGNAYSNIRELQDLRTTNSLFPDLYKNTPELDAKTKYNLLKDFAKSASNLREFGRANSTAVAYDASASLINTLGKTPSEVIKNLGPTQGQALSDTYGYAKDLKDYYQAFNVISDSIRYRTDVSPQVYKALQDIIPSDTLKKATSKSPEDLGEGSVVFEEGPELKQIVNSLYSQLQQSKTKFLDSADKLAVAFAVGGTAAAVSGEAEARGMADMDAAAVLPDSNILEEFKSVQSMINDAKAQEKINDPATLKAIRTKHKELLSKLIDSAMEE